MSNTLILLLYFSLILFSYWIMLSRSRLFFCWKYFSFFDYFEWIVPLLLRCPKLCYLYPFWLTLNSLLWYSVELAVDILFDRKVFPYKVFEREFFVGVNSCSLLKGEFEKCFILYYLDCCCDGFVDSVFKLPCGLYMVVIWIGVLLNCFLLEPREHFAFSVYSLYTLKPGVSGAKSTEDS